MRLLAALVIVALMLCSPARAESFFDKLGKEINKFGKSVERELGKIDQPRRKSRDQWAATCLIFDKSGARSDEQTCAANVTCRKDSECHYVFTWPSGGRTTVQIAPGDEPKLNGKTARSDSLEGLDCVANLSSGDRFCWRNEEKATAPPIAGHTEPSDDEGGGVPPPSADRDVSPLEKLTKAEEIERFFSDKDLASLAPIDAEKACLDRVYQNGSILLGLLPGDVTRLLKIGCQAGAARYGERMVQETAATVIAATNALPATLTGLKEHNWFKPDTDALAKFSRQQGEQLIALYWPGIEEHFRKAVQAASTEIKAAYQNADPLKPLPETIARLCELRGSVPTVLRETCSAEQKRFKERSSQALCNQAASRSGASAAMLEMSFRVFGPGYDPWPLRRVLCEGAVRKPTYRFEVGNGAIPFLTEPSLQIFERDNLLLDVALQITTKRDDRSFGQLLIDIATGENERDVLRILEVERIRHADPTLGLPANAAIVGCALDLIKCR